MTLAIMREGYHYTSLESWCSIQEEGIAPQVIYDYAVTETLQRVQDGGDQKKGPVLFYGIWVWPKMEHGVGHLGNILRVMAARNTTKVCLLKVKFSENDILRANGQMVVSINHSGNIGNFKYHNGREKALILSTWIGPNEIELVHEYDLLEMIDVYERQQAYNFSFNTNLEHSGSHQELYREFEEFLRAKHEARNPSS
jgi:hypothetical protein